MSTKENVCFSYEMKCNLFNITKGNFTLKINCEENILEILNKANVYGNTLSIKTSDMAISKGLRIISYYLENNVLYLNMINVNPYDTYLRYKDPLFDIICI